jgi:spore germination protein KB
MIENKSITSRQLITLMVLFLFGSSVVVGVNINSDVGQDSWLSLIFSFAFSIPAVLIISRIIILFPQKNIYEIFDELFGKTVGKILSLLFVLHILYNGSIVLRNFSEFVEITTLSDTPPLPVMLSLILIVIYLAKSNIKILARWGPICLTIILITVTFTMILSAPVIDFNYIKPILGHNFLQMTISAFSIFMVPFSQILIFLGLADFFDIKGKEKRTYLLGISITGILLLTIMIRNIMVLGAPLLKDTFFSSYEAARIVRLGEFLTRIEGVITINFILAGITKITVFAIVLARGLAHISKNSNYKNLVVPSCLLILALCPFLFDNVMDLFDFAPIFGMIIIPIQVILPIVIWFTAEYKNRKKKHNPKINLKGQQLTFN